MAIDRKISDLNPYAGGGTPEDDDLFVSAREDATNWKINFKSLSRHSAERVDSMYTTGDQNVYGIKTYDSFILGNVSGNLTGYSRYVYDGVYTTGEQEIGGRKTFLNPITGDISGYSRYVQDGVYLTGEQDINGPKRFLKPITGDISGYAMFVRNGVYITGDQTIRGEKTFQDFITANVSGNISGYSRYVQDGVYITGDQDIDGRKNFLKPITGDISGYSRYVQDGVYITGVQEIGGHKKFTNPITGNVSGFSRYVQDGVYLTGNQTIQGEKTFNEFVLANISGNLSGTALHVASGVYTSGDQFIEGKKDFIGELYLSGLPVLTDANLQQFIQDDAVVVTDVDQNASGDKTFLGVLRASGLIETYKEGGSLVIADDRSRGSNIPRLTQNIHEKDKALSLVFDSGVYVTGGVVSPADLHVEGTIYAEQVEALEDIIGSDGPMVFTDGRDPNLFPTPDNSLAFVFDSGVYITGGIVSPADLHVEGTIYAEQVEALEDIIGSDGPMVFTDGRDPNLFPTPDNSLAFVFDSGVYVTGGIFGPADLHVEGTIYAEKVEALEDIIGSDGPMVFTDGRDPNLFPTPDNSLAFVFDSGVYITGGIVGPADLYVEGTIYAEKVEALEDIIGSDGPMVFTDGRDPDLFPTPDNSLAFVFDSGVYITGGILGPADLHVEGTVYAEKVEALENIIGSAGPMVFTDGRDPNLFPAIDHSLVFAFESGVYVTGSNLNVQGTGFFDAISSHQDAIYLTGKNVEIDRNLKINGNLEVGSISVSSKKIDDILHISFTDNQSAARVYMPLHAGEGTSMDSSTPIENQRHVIVAPYDGKLKQITFRPRRIGAGSSNAVNDVTFGIAIGSDDYVDQATEVTSIETSPDSYDIPSDPELTYVYEFNDAQHFSSGDAVLIYIDRDSAATPGVRPHRSSNYITISAHLEYNT